MYAIQMKNSDPFCISDAGVRRWGGAARRRAARAVTVLGG